MLCLHTRSQDHQIWRAGHAFGCREAQRQPQHVLGCLTDIIQSSAVCRSLNIRSLCQHILTFSIKECSCGEHTCHCTCFHGSIPQTVVQLSGKACGAGYGPALYRSGWLRKISGSRLPGRPHWHHGDVLHMFVAKCANE